jgi:predicted aconitase
MELGERDRAMLDGHEGEAAQFAMELLVAVAEA